MAVCVPTRDLWGRLKVEGLEALPRGGPTLVVANHDSQTDPIAVGVAARKRRQIRALAKRSLWNKPGLGRILDGMGQIPIERAAGDAGALVNAVEALRAGACIGVFPEGTISVGRGAAGAQRRRPPRARGPGGAPGLRRRSRAAPTSRASRSGRGSASASSSRPRARPIPPRPPPASRERLLDELRAVAPPVDAGRDPAKTLEKYERKLAEREEAAAQPPRRSGRSRAGLSRGLAATLSARTRP